MHGFKCPECGHDRLVERRVSLEETEEVTGITSGDKLQYTGIPTVTGGEVSSYECAKCCVSLAGVESPEQLVALLRGRPSK
jgi:DNA-directed RNA polymerase subunit RPC12/RpoP